MMESEGDWPYSWFDITNLHACLQRLNVMQIRLWLQIRDQEKTHTPSDSVMEEIVRRVLQVLTPEKSTFG